MKNTGLATRCLGTPGFVVKTTTIGEKRRKEPRSPVSNALIDKVNPYKSLIYEAEQVKARARRQVRS